MALKLFISDVDGTLVRSDKSLAEATIRAVGRLKAIGVPMSLISARPPSGLRWIAEALDLEGPFGAFNGGTLFLRDGSLLSQHFVGRPVAEAMIGLMKRAGITIWVFAGGEWFSSDGDNPHTPREIRSANIQSIVTDSFEASFDIIDKIVGVNDDPILMAELEQQAVALIGTGATVARSQPYYLDITATVANKGAGIEHLARSYGIDLADVAVIGDQANDLPMFAKAGFSIAMGQGPDLVRAAATRVTSPVDEDGVAHAIDEILLPSLLATP